MAGMFLVRTDDPEFAGRAAAAARAQFARHGFAACTEIELPGWRLLHAPHIIGGPDNLLRAPGGDLAAVAGTIAVDGRMGRPALEALLESTAKPEPDWSRIAGQFAALVRKGDRTFLFADWFAAFQLFHDPQMRFFSTSLLAAAAALPRLSFDPQGVYEFAFNVVPVGDDTVFQELKTLGPDRAVELSPGGAIAHPLAKPMPEAPDDRPVPDRIERLRGHLSTVLRPHVAAFGSNVRAPLSGGLDSRLLLAALRAESCEPDLYVYGAPGDADVRIAEAICKAQGRPLEIVDKDRHRTLTPDEFPEQVARNFEEYDGLPNFGTLFDNGANADARDARHRGGALAASGGCGEVFRNFFYLPDRRLRAAAVARTFFARFAPGDATDAFDRHAFLRAIEDKILAALGRPGDLAPLPRTLVEQVYPRIRCRSLFGREISLEARYGAYAMPFLDHRVAAEAATIPLRLKNAGRFEAMLIDAIDPALAAFPSAYGHSFAGPPGRGHLFAEWSTRVRPVWLRARSYAIQRRLKPMGDEHGGLLGEEYLGRVIDLNYPAMRRFFRPERIGDFGVLRRIANLEYLAARLGSKLAA